MNVIDNFLPDHVHNRIESNLLGPQFPWNFNTATVYGSDCGLEDFQFVHDFYAPISGPVSNYYSLIDSIIDLLGVKYLVRVKANLNTNTHTLFEREFHRDVDLDCKTAIYYVNTNDGYTRFEDGTKIESVANRIAVFESNLKHCGTTCTNTKSRVVINLNYFD